MRLSPMCVSVCVFLFRVCVLCSLSLFSLFLFYHIVRTRWGRVGENGQAKLEGPFSSEGEAVTKFSKKFRDKAGYAWAGRLGDYPFKAKKCKR